MKLIRRLYHFLGSIVFALILIASVAFFVVAGTLLESVTQSHRYAAYFTYDNPIFALLLWGFFINILFSATRRWPFQFKHIPFLITHLGLLMILGGTLMKHYFGLQGSMSVVEGSGSHEIFEMGSYAIQVESRHDHSPMRYPLKKTFNGELKGVIADRSDGLQLRLIEFAPHSSERLSTWIKGDNGIIEGLHPLPVHILENGDPKNDIPVSGKVRFYESSKPHHLYAIRTDDVENVIHRLYYQNTTLLFTDRISDKPLLEYPMQEAIHSPIKLTKYFDAAKVALHVNFSCVDGFNSPKVDLALLNRGHEIKMSIPLNGGEALFNLNETTPYLGKLSMGVDLQCFPFLALIQDEHDDLYLVAMDQYGSLWSKPFRNEAIDSLIVYDEGFGGYAVRAVLPFVSFNTDRQHREAALNARVKGQLQQAINEHIPLSPPLELLHQACEEANIDFIDTCLEFLNDWDAGHSWLFQEHRKLSPKLTMALQHINWKKVPERERMGCFWTKKLFEQINSPLEQGMDLIDILDKTHWPLLSLLKAQRKHQGPCSAEESMKLLTLLTQQVFAAVDLLSHSNEITAQSLSAEDHASFLSAYLRAYGIHLGTISPIANSDDMQRLLLELAKEQSNEVIREPIVIETHVTSEPQGIPPTQKLEDNIPKTTLLATRGKHSQKISLSYDRFGKGLKWPILNGSYLVRFQPLFIDIPYHIRLRQARQINYANSTQPYSFESELVVTDRRSGMTVEKTISMNHVHETWDGYRFYLSSISPSDESSVKHIQLVVNYDPAKYWLTYPGALILSLGILLLFWMRPYQKK